MPFLGIMILAFLVIVTPLAVMAEGNPSPAGGNKEASQTVSAEDLEVIKNLALLEDLESIENEDVSFLENYPDAEQAAGDGEKRDE